MRTCALRASLLILFVAAGSGTAWSQVVDGLTVRARIGFDRYELGALHDWQALDRTQWQGENVPVESTDRFGAHPGLRLEVATRLFGVHRAGLTLGVSSTGGRNHYGDYSGEIQSDWSTTRYALGVMIEQPVVRRGSWAALFTLHGSYSLSRLSYETSIRLGDEEASDDLTLSARSMGVDPEVVFEITLPGSALVRLGAGFGFSVGGTLALEGTPVQIEGTSSALRVDWTGWRMSVGVGFNLIPVRARPNSTEGDS